MTEPYVKAGRGGAGNFYSKQELRDAGQAAVTVNLLLSFLYRHFAPNVFFLSLGTVTAHFIHFVVNFKKLKLISCHIYSRRRNDKIPQFQLKANQSQNDLEANLTNGRLINDLTLTRTATTSQPLPDYQHTGRGGAGNVRLMSLLNWHILSGASPLKHVSRLDIQLWTQSLLLRPSCQKHMLTSLPLKWVEPKSLCAQGLVQEASPNPTSTASTTPSSSASISGTKRTAGQSKPTYRGGRGGAGNYTDFEADEKRRREEKERLRAEMEKRVEADIEAGLARPPRSYQGVGGAWEMGSLS
jgi:hypothetical protein